jgi:hypothetical protein
MRADLGATCEATARRRGTTTALLALLLLVGPVADGVAETPTEVVSARLLPSTVDPADGFATVVVEVHLRDPDGLADRMRPVSIDAPFAAVATTEDGTRAIGWPELVRVAGSATDGTWRGVVEVTPYWASHRYTLATVQAVAADGTTEHVTVVGGPTATVSGAQAWGIRPIREPVRVVTGDERWIPRAQVVDLRTGVPVAGAGVDIRRQFDLLVPRRTTAPPTTTATDGTWAGPSRSVLTDDLHVVAYGRRGSRGHSLEDAGCLGVTVKLQARAQFSTTSLRPGGTLTVTGNGWPAPAIHPMGYGSVHLQRAVDGRWATIASSRVRDNGRYTLTWPAERGTWSLRVRRPGQVFWGVDRACAASIGTSLAPVEVVVR